MSGYPNQPSGYGYGAAPHGYGAPPSGQPYGAPPPSQPYSANPYGAAPPVASPYSAPYSSGPKPSGDHSHSYGSGYPPSSVPSYPSPFASLVPSAFPPNTDPTVIACFQLADQDGSGLIDDKELQRALSSYNQPFSLRTVHLLMYHFTNTNTRKIGNLFNPLSRFASIAFAVKFGSGILGFSLILAEGMDLLAYYT